MAAIELFLCAYVIGIISVSSSLTLSFSILAVSIGGIILT